MLYLIEGRLGTGKSLTATRFVVGDHLKRELLIAGMDIVRVSRTTKEAVEGIVSTLGISKEAAVRVYEESVEVFREEGRDTYLAPIQILSTNHLKGVPFTKVTRQWFIDHIEDTELSNCVFLLDESYLWADSRNTPSKENKLVYYYVGQTRKRNVDMYLMCHHRDTLDKRIRRLVNVIMHPVMITGPLEEHLPIDERKYNWVTVDIQNLDTGVERRHRFYGPDYWDYYDTNEVGEISAKQKEVTL